MPSTFAYLFLELAIVAYVVGFGWEHWTLKELFSRAVLCTALCLAAVWFVLDQTALALGFWSFPAAGTMPVRIIYLPIEEYLIFFIHTLVCFVLVKRYSEVIQ
jgi:lycopene cyclase domain-containing protein